MPLSTQIIRDGEPLELRWSDFHVAAMALAASFETGGIGKGALSGPGNVYEADPELFACYPDAPLPITRELAFMLCSYPMLSKTPLGHAGYTLTGRHQFRDPRDGEILTLLPGDELFAYRS